MGKVEHMLVELMLVEQHLCTRLGAVSTPGCYLMDSSQDILVLFYSHFTDEETGSEN